MDSILTYLVDEDISIDEEVGKVFKKILNSNYAYLIRSVENSLRLILNSYSKDDKESKNEVIISGLAPYYIYNIILECGFIPRVIDVSLDDGLPEYKEIIKNISDNSALLVNVFNYTVKPKSQEILDLDIPTIDIMLSGLGLDISGNILYFNADYTIISLESENIINSFGGSVLIYNNENKFIHETLQLRNDLQLSGLNASFVNSLLSDMNQLFERKLTLIEVYKNSILKSGYYTFENNETNSYNYFPVIVTKSLRDIQLYCKHNELITYKGFEDSIVKKIPGIKCSNARSLSGRTLLIPLSITIKKDTIELISKILSTLP